MQTGYEPIAGRAAEIALAARALIAERGFEGLRTRDIAARVGINVATLHYHVPSKEALIELVARSLRDDFVAQNTARPRGGLPALEQLKLEFLDFRETLVETPEIFVVMTELTERARRDEKVKAVVGPILAFAHGELARILALGRDEGTFRADLDPEAGALMIFGTMVATQRSPKRGPELFDRACAELLRSVRARPSESRASPHNP
jgi:AcrR family transcriptional regulator